MRPIVNLKIVFFTLLILTINFSLCKSAGRIPRIGLFETGLNVERDISFFGLPLPGEPIPGAEIYVELEPDDQPIAPGPANEEGDVVFNITVPPTPPNPPTPVVTPKGIKIYISFPAESWKYLAAKNKRTEVFGTYTFQLDIKIGRAKYTKEFTTVIKSETDIKAAARKKSAPLEQLFTSGEIPKNDSRSPIKVPCNIRLQCSNIR